MDFPRRTKDTSRGVQGARLIWPSLSALLCFLIEKIACLPVVCEPQVDSEPVLVFAPRQCCVNVCTVMICARCCVVCFPVGWVLQGKGVAAPASNRPVVCVWKVHACFIVCGVCCPHYFFAG